MNRRKMIHRAGWCLSLILAAGCEGNGPPTAADPDEARKTLDRALEAWRGGKTIDALKGDSTPILVADPAWEKGATLKRFEVAGPGKEAGAERTFAVNIWTTDAKGKESKQQVDYRVGTRPILTVFRALF